MPSPRTYSFDGITMDCAAMRLCRGETELQLEPKSFRLLQYLIENRDRVLSKDEIFRVVWEQQAVSDNSLTRAIAQIRKVLDDDSRTPRYIDTIPTVGYRFIGTLETANHATPQSPPAPSHSSRTRRLAAWAAVAVVVLVAAGILLWHSPVKPANTPPISSPVPLTTYRGSEDSPSFSPDGDQVAFEWNGEKSDNFDIYVKSLNPDATPLRLTTDPAPDVWPAWSPDGRTIAFQRYVSAEKTDLILIPALGGPERKLGEFRLWIDPSGFSPTWSPDSKWLVVPVASGSGTTLMRVSAETGEATPILPQQESLGDTFPDLSPDGSTLLYLRHSPYNWGELWSVRVDSNMNPVEAPHQINAGGIPFRQAKWTADGKEIVACVPGGAVRLPATGTDTPRGVSLTGTYLHGIEASRRGNRLAYAEVLGDSNIWRIDLSAKIPHPELLIASTRRDVYPQYSPDGRRITFHSPRSGLSQVWVSDADGKNPQQLTSSKSGITGTAHWSPDGKTITFDSNTTGVYQVYSMNADGGEVKQLTHGAYGNFGGVWSHDGHWVYYTSKATGRNEIWKMTPGGGNALQITHNGGMMGAESPDGQTIYFCKESGSGSIWKISANGGPEEQIVNSLYRSNFSVTRQGIYYVTAQRADGTSELMFYSFAHKVSTLVLPIGVPEYGMDVSPDGRYVAYAQLDDPASDLMLIENFH